MALVHVLSKTRNVLPLYCGLSRLSFCTKSDQNTFEVTFVTEEGEKFVGRGTHGDSLRQVVVNNKLNIEGYGACEGTLNCCSCHVILSKSDFKKLRESQTEEEIDMMDFIVESSATSRLGCQVRPPKEMIKIQVQLPSIIKDIRTNSNSN